MCTHPRPQGLHARHGLVRHLVDCLRLCAERGFDRLCPRHARRRARCCHRTSLRSPTLELQLNPLLCAQPSSLGILGSSFPPGQRKTTAFALFSAGAPLGGSLGSVLGGVCVLLSLEPFSPATRADPSSCYSLTEYAAIKWRAIFHVSAGIGALIGVSALWLVPADRAKDKSLTVDWLGGLLITSAIVLLTFSLADGEGAPDGVRLVPPLLSSHSSLRADPLVNRARSGRRPTSRHSSSSASSSSSPSGSGSATSSTAPSGTLSCTRRSGRRVASLSSSSSAPSGGAALRATCSSARSRSRCVASLSQPQSGSGSC